MEKKKETKPKNGKATGRKEERKEPRKETRKDVFDVLHPKVKELAKNRFGKATQVQNLAIPKILQGRNVLAIAGTGFGKTEAVMLPVFSLWLKEKPQPISILYICPLRSLNRDMFRRLLWWGNKLDMDISVRHGDTTQYERSKQSEFPPDLLISTPETLQAILPGSRMKENLSNIKWVVIDEIHELVSNKRGIQLSLGLERLRQLSKDFQIIGLSATVGSPRKVADFLKKDTEIVKSISIKDLDIEVVSPRVEQEDKKLGEEIFLGAEATARLRKIHELVKNKKSLVFTNTREAAEVLSSRLRRLEYEGHGIHHSSLSKDVRIQAEDMFKSDELNALICTSSLELGIDIGTVEQVVQFMSPRQVSKIVQRVGRSGHRVGSKSRGIIIASDPDDVMEAGVIARKAMAGELEKTEFHDLAYDVLSHQLIGLALDKYGIDWKEAYEIARSAYPYKELTKSDFSRLAKFLEILRMIYLDTGLKRRRKSWRYYYENLSTIPNIYQYRIIDNVDDREVGVLDEAFVAEHGDTGTTFIVKGSPWRVLSVYSGKVFVEPVDDITSAIPAWEGELIPVTREIAQEVGELRSLIKEKLKKKMKNENITEEIRKKYPISEDACQKVIDYVKNQVKSKDVPDDKTILIESDKDFVVIHSCFGSLINQTLSRFFSALLTTDLGKSVGIKNDPYRIMIQGVTKEQILKVVKENTPEDFEIVIENTVDRTQMFRWRFIHVAKRFGAVRKDAKWDKMNLSKLVDSYRGSPIYDEASKEVFMEKLDMKGAKEIFKKIKNSEINLVVDEKTKLSPMGKVGVEYQFRELVGPEKPEREIFTVFKHRLLNTRVRLVCMKCGQFSVTKPVGMIKDDPECPLCGSRFITVIKPHEKEKERIVKKNIQDKPLSDEEKKKLERMENAADLVLTYGSRVITALAGRGVGPDTAIRILAKQKENNEDFLREILQAERNFAKTKRFWS
ncbi:MAG: DEAD/DEAH box helicase [archaeon]|nr:MAG: DEAD/DEAH box helicase [archaeon]